MKLASVQLCFAQGQPLVSLKRPRAQSESVIVCKASPLISIAAASAALLLIPSFTPAKGILSTNTIFRRYVVTDGDALLRYALPLPAERYSDDPVPIRMVQEQLERLGVDLRARGAAGLIGGRRDMAKLRSILAGRRLDILLDVPGMKRQKAAELLSSMETCLDGIEDELGVSEQSQSSLFPRQLQEVSNTVSDAFARRNGTNRKTVYDAVQIESFRQSALQYVGAIEELAVEGSGLPFRVPRRYNEYPRLVGRAKVRIRLQKGDGTWSDDEEKSVGKEVSLVATLDGYSAPLTAGNFFDIVQSGYYNNTRVLASQREFFAQLGERDDDNVQGYRDSKSGRKREIPLEILVDGEEAPNYGGTLDELGIGDLQPILPISGYGAMAMVHSVENANDASSQFYVFFLDPTSYQARSFGGSILTGSVSTFGYITEGREYLRQMQAGDKIAGMKVISGEENFRQRGDS